MLTSALLIILNYSVKSICMLSFYLIGLMVIVFFLQAAAGITELFYFDPAVAIAQPYRFITSVFLHGSITHLFYNMFALAMFGPLLETKLGASKFMQLFIAGGIIGSVLYYLFVIIGISPPIPALGASGAIYAILGALSMITPNLVIYFWFFPMRIRNAAILWIALEFLGAFNPNSGIASAAHLGGLIFGIAYGWFINKQHSDLEYYY